MNAAFSPRSHFETDLAAITRPLLLLAGDADEAFHAELYEPVISAHTDMGEYHILPGVTHMGLLSDPKGIQVIEDWLRQQSP
ncbi:MAG: hypothetical protein HQ514_13045 [Rhodospirillales bacterium]|nr:hypothetical protein [Rhodospirillales bacterium]